MIASTVEEGFQYLLKMDRWKRMRKERKGKEERNSPSTVEEGV
jgi:hypothetical protein